MLRLRSPLRDQTRPVPRCVRTPTTDIRIENAASSIMFSFSSSGWPTAPSCPRVNCLGSSLSTRQCATRHLMKTDDTNEFGLMKLAHSWKERERAWIRRDVASKMLTTGEKLSYQTDVISIRKCSVAQAINDDRLQRRSPAQVILVV